MCPAVMELPARVMGLLDSAYLVLIWVLFVSELVVTEISHSLTLRLTMAHSLVLALLATGMLWSERSRSHKWGERFVSVCQAMCQVGMGSLCVVNIVHAVQMLAHRHDTGVHNTSLLLTLAALDLFIKLLILCSRDQSFPASVAGQTWSVAFHIVSAVAVFVISLLRFLSFVDLILWLDPSLTILAALILLCSIYFPLKDHILILLLAVPDSMDSEALQTKFRTKFPDLDVEDLRVWRESKNEVRLSTRVHFRGRDKDGGFPRNSSHASQLNLQVVHFFQKEGVHRVMIQPEFYQLT